MTLKPLTLGVTKISQYPDELEVPYFSGCVPLWRKPENQLAHGCNQSTSSRNLEKEFYDMPPLVWLCPATSFQ